MDDHSSIFRFFGMDITMDIAWILEPGKERKQNMPDRLALQNRSTGKSLNIPKKTGNNAHTRSC